MYIMIIFSTTVVACGRPSSVSEGRSITNLVYIMVNYFRSLNPRIYSEISFVESGNVVTNSLSRINTEISEWHDTPKIKSKFLPFYCFLRSFVDLCQVFEGQVSISQMILHGPLFL